MGFGKIIKVKNYIHSLPFTFVSIFPILPNALQAISFAIFLLQLLYDVRLQLSHRLLVLYNWHSYLILTIFYLLNLLTFFYETEHTLNLTIVQSSVLLAVAPFFMIFCHKNNAANFKYIVWVFTTSVIFYLVVLYLYLKYGVEQAYSFYKTSIDFKNFNGINFNSFLITNSFEYIHSIASWGYYKKNMFIELNTHHAYISSLINLNILFLGKLYCDVKEKNFFYLIIILFFCLSIFYLGSKLNIIFLLAILTLTICFLLSKILKKKLLLLFFGIMLALCFIQFQRFIDVSTFVENPMSLVTKCIDEERITLYNRILPTIKNHIISGVGINNVYPLIDSIMISSPHLYKFNVPSYLNSPHSQFLFYLFSGGIVILVLFMFMFLYLIYRYYLQGNLWGGLFIVLIILNCLFEDYLNRAFGVFIFIFGNLILWKPELNEE
jgi:O-antigen ligase